jgi:hypothetical protein
VDGPGRLTEPAPRVVEWGNCSGDARLSPARHQYTSKSDHTRFVHTICGDKAPLPLFGKGREGGFCRRRHTRVYQCHAVRSRSSGLWHGKESHGAIRRDPQNHCRRFDAPEQQGRLCPDVTTPSQRSNCPSNHRGIDKLDSPPLPPSRRPILMALLFSAMMQK